MNKKEGGNGQNAAEKSSVIYVVFNQAIIASFLRFC